MVARNANIVGITQSMSVLVSVLIMIAGKSLIKEPDYTCVEFLQLPLMILGFSMSYVAALGFIGECWRPAWRLILYLVTMFILILVLATMVVLIYFITNNDFHGWLPYNWDSIRACLNSTHMCSELNHTYHDFFNDRLTSVQYGCCMPPAECGFTYVNATYWLSPNNTGGTAATKDCLQWSNDQSQLCFHCDSCKAGLLDDLTKEWRRVDLALFIILVVLICLYLVGFCCAFRKSKTSDEEEDMKGVVTLGMPKPRTFLEDINKKEMAERNNNIVGIIILITMFLTAPIIGCGILLAKEPDNTCSVEILPWALIILGFSIQAVTLLAVLRDNWRLSSWPFIVYFVAMFIFILLLAAMVVLIYLVTDKGSGHPSPAPGRSYVEHDLNDFHGWLRRKVATPYKWNRIRSYLNSTHMCSELNQKYRTSQDFFNARLTAVQAQQQARIACYGAMTSCNSVSIVIHAKLDCLII
ncbi:Tetraspanin/Peripherin [Corchorus olitorius]|uniref:Tetraspanin/Peripherin n=1 Tax=Corchorus olitorius TaxID=93759 RepID=A0A1R3JER2_9ROSI|nr:Tetraspanin/Peripherin [Corchorus olitorius]